MIVFTLILFLFIIITLVEYVHNNHYFYVVNNNMIAIIHPSLIDKFAFNIFFYFMVEL